MTILRLQDIFDNFKGKIYFTTLDTSKVYHQSFMDKHSRHFTAFTSPWGLAMATNTAWTVERTPCISKSYERMFAELRDSICIPYMDDIVCYRKKFNEHLVNLRRVLRRLKNFGVKFKAEKGIFLKK